MPQITVVDLCHIEVFQLGLIVLLFTIKFYNLGHEVSSISTNLIF